MESDRQPETMAYQLEVSEEGPDAVEHSWTKKTRCEDQFKSLMGRKSDMKMNELISGFLFLTHLNKFENRAKLSVDGHDVSKMKATQGSNYQTAIQIPESYSNNYEGKTNDRSNGSLQNKDRDGELKDMENFAYLLSMLSYSFMYWLLSASIGKTVNNYANVMMGVNVWTLLLVLVLFITSFGRCSVEVTKTIRFVMSGLLFISTLVVFVLIQIIL